MAKLAAPNTNDLYVASMYRHMIERWQDVC
jgi:hypothetical protein